MSAIGPGDWVECVDASGANGGGLFDGGFLVLGRIYQVEKVTKAKVAGGGFVPSVLLVGQPKRHAASGRRGSYDLRRFRPIYRPKSEIIEALKQPAPERAMEDA